MNVTQGKSRIEVGKTIDYLCALLSLYVISLSFLSQYLCEMTNSKIVGFARMFVKIGHVFVG